MKRHSQPCLLVLLSFCLTSTLMAQDSKDDGFTNLFNGKDLTGWMFLKTTLRKTRTGIKLPPRAEFDKNITLDGKTQSDDGRYVAKDGALVVTKPAERRHIHAIWTKQRFAKDFILKLEFRASKGADSGIFLRGKQLQCRDYPNAGPYKDLKNYKSGDWNQIVVTVKGQLAHCTCNGEVIEEAYKIPASGAIGLEGDRGQMEYRNIQIKEL